MSKGLGSRLRSKLTRLMKPEPKGRPKPAAQDYALAVPFGDDAVSQGDFQVAVMIHLFHPEMAAELRSLCEAIPAPCDLLITTDTDAKSQAIRKAFDGWLAGGLDVRIVANRGRDIAPKLTAYREEYGRYDLVLFLHSKKSATVDWGEDWRKQILSSLVGNERVVASVLALFARDPELGMVAPKTFERVHAMMQWGDTKDAIALAKRLELELDLDAPFDFPAGSMFWARPKALKPLLDLGLSASDFPEEAGQTGATLAHAIERIFYIVCEQAGYSWLKVANPAFFSEKAALIPVDDQQTLDVEVSKAWWRVSDAVLIK